MKVYALLRAYMKMYVLLRAYMKIMSAQSIDKDALLTMQMYAEWSE